MKTHEDVVEAMKKHFISPETDNESSKSSSISLSYSSSMSKKESSSEKSSLEDILLKKDEKKTILIEYLSQNIHYLKKYNQKIIENIIKKDYVFSSKFLINVLNSNGYLGCSDIGDLLKCLDKYPEVVDIQLDNNEISMIDEKMGDLKG